MIKEAYVSFETAKLLKGKGFDIECKTAYYCDCLIDYTMFGFCGDEEFIFAPTQQLAMAWLREIHNIFIVIEPHLYDYVNEKNKSYICSLWVGDNYYENPLKKGFPSYEETVESAIKYCLENLI